MRGSELSNGLVATRGLCIIALIGLAISLQMGEPDLISSTDVKNDNFFLVQLAFKLKS